MMAAPSASDLRNSYRVLIPSILTLTPVMFISAKGPLQGRLLDISRQGAAALLDAQVRAEIGTRVPCTIHLLDRRFATKAEVRSADARQGYLRLGLLFADLSPAQHHFIDASIAALERTLLRDYAQMRLR